MLERVIVLEEGQKRTNATLDKINERLIGIEAELKHLPKAADYASLKADVARVDGKLSNIPTMWQLLTMVVSTWAAGAAIVFTILRFGGK
ncbi:MAG: hypothetical protein K2Z25_08900 [Beijerinckiaceae bacterium]|nr:hypothetical protein [Beijerinckiaceae bacterium]